MKNYLPLILLLLLGFGLRIFNLTEVPPGLTHDEANHGREAIEILDGVLRFYFPLNYGSEPLYSYTVAGSMLLLGETLFALRFVNILFGLGTICLSYHWIRIAFDQRTALITAALLAVSFWPLATSRQALRAGMLPFFTVLAVLFFWQTVQQHSRPTNQRRTAWLLFGFGTAVALTLHIYLAARIAWLIFPIFLLFLLGWHRHTSRRLWLPVLLGLLWAGLLVTPMFVYLEANPAALTRLTMLDGPLQALRSGNLQPLLQNGSGALLALVWPGFGDTFLAYNIPGRPLFDAVTALFFFIGLLVAARDWRQPASAFLLLWLVIGLAPSLITGATANSTRNMAAMTPLYTLPALGFGQTAVWLRQKQPQLGRLAGGTAVLWLLFVGWQSSQDYFGTWANMPEVRGAYQRNLVESLTYISQTRDPDSTLIISSVYPGPVHDPSLALVLAATATANARWIDARYGMILPADGPAVAVIPTSTTPHPYWQPLLNPITSRTLRQSDLDPSYTIYTLDSTQLRLDPTFTAVNFGNAFTLIAAEWLTGEVQAGETAALLTVWHISNPELAGPIVPPAYTTDLVLFTQLLHSNNSTVIAQRDSLEAPSWSWQAGDRVLQIHPLQVPADVQPGRYPVIVGAYDRTSGNRIFTVNEAGETAASFASVPNLTISPP